jgi:ubiquinone/menaquinone biosynthesis C-methylase UbiE
MTSTDVYRITNQLDDETLEVMAARLEARGRHPRFVAMFNQYLDAMEIDGARSVLDLGCGTGVIARAIGRRPGFSGSVAGIDRSPNLIDAAVRLVREEGLDRRVAFHAGDSHTLQLEDRAFDAVVAHTLFSHLEDPRIVLAEIVRVLSPGGKIAIFDGDFASMTFAGDDPAAARAIDEAIIGAVVTHPRVMREMPQLLREAGLGLTAAFPHVIADVGRMDYWASSIQSMTRLLPKSGAMTEAQAEAWAASMARRSEEGTFFGACNFYGYIAVKA